MPLFSGFKLNGLSEKNMGRDSLNEGVFSQQSFARTDAKLCVRDGLNWHGNRQSYFRVREKGGKPHHTGHCSRLKKISAEPLNVRDLIIDFILLGCGGIQHKKKFHVSGTSFCDSDRIQTCNLLIRSQMLYSVELRSLVFVVCGCKGSDKI